MFMIPLVFVLPNIAELVAIPSGQPVPTIIKSAVGSSAGAFVLLVPLLVLGVICGIGCTTAASRATWAFARDGAIPGSQWWKRVDTRLDIPFNAMMLSSKHSRSHLLLLRCRAEVQITDSDWFSGRPDNPGQHLLWVLGGVQRVHWSRRHRPHDFLRRAYCS